MRTEREFSKSEMAFFSPSIDYQPMIHEGLEIIYSVSGTATAFIDGKEYEITPNSLLFVFPNQVHSYSNSSSNDESAFFTALIHPKKLYHYSGTAYSYLPINPVYIPNDHFLLNLMEIAQHEFLFGNPETLDLLITAILTKFIPKIELKKRDIPNDIISKILIYCNEHYKEQITTAQIAAYMKISKKHLSHLFNKTLHISFTNYINSLRISEAVNLINKNEKLITDIAFEVGFGSINTFNRAFRSVHGVTPSEYKKTYHTYGIKE